MAYYRQQHLNAGFTDTVERVRTFLTNEGYVIPSEVNVTESFRNLLDKEFRNYVILMTGKPGLAYEAMSTDPNIGTVLPVHIIVYEDDRGATVAAMEPALLQQGSNDTLTQLSKALDELLTRLFGQITS